MNGNDLIELGFPKRKVIGLALDWIATQPEGSEAASISMLTALLADPEAYASHAELGAIAEELMSYAREAEKPQLRSAAGDYQIYGEAGIEDGAKNQLNTAMRLPVTLAGALMADAHQGYGLPIGGVLATENAVIPYGVGVDIGCRMCLTVFDLPVTDLDDRKTELRQLLVDNTRFGRATFQRPEDHAVLENPLFQEVQVVKELKDRAAAQIGSSGGGNHFVEFGLASITDPDNEFELPVGEYLALLSHSGSRGFGANIANHYTRLARKLCELPDEAKHLAWLDLDSEAGQEYWLAMNLAGDYASACHHQIHERMERSLQAGKLARVENHHNFAWKETGPDGQEWIVHRKGATPAGKGELGIIPGSMTAPGFIVRGKGSAASINSASHGAGRVMSRTEAKRTLDVQHVSRYVAQAGVEVIGSGIDEAPMAYKDIHQVMQAQADLVDVIGQFQPRIVRMCGDQAFREVD